MPSGDQSAAVSYHLKKNKKQTYLEGALNFSSQENVSSIKINLEIACDISRNGVLTALWLCTVYLHQKKNLSSSE